MGRLQVYGFLYIGFFTIFNTHLLIPEEQPARYWIFFSDKRETAGDIRPDVSGAYDYLTDLALERRTKVRPYGQLVDMYDAPVSGSYRDRIKAITDSITVTSRWLNAVSAPLTHEQVRSIRVLPFVEKVQPVGKIHPPRPLPGEPSRDVPGDLFPLRSNELQYDSRPGTLSYGLSETQIIFHNIHVLHRQNITGAGVRIGFLDTGYLWKNHRALQNALVLAERDFVAEHYPDDVLHTGHYIHGTHVFSVVGGYEPDRFIGVSFESAFLLGATEDVRSETPVEEDFWVAGLEWMESMGVDIVSSSLGYSTFDEPYASYTTNDMDGRTAVTTLAAERAFERGVLLVVSAGNEGNSTWRIITAPADGEHVVSVGALDPAGAVTPWSSRGPTADNRIKPDISALGTGVFGAGTEDGIYRSASGTSLAAPLVSGTAGLILAARPDFTAAELRNAFRMSARRVGEPNNDYGWGVLDAPAALAYPVVRYAGGVVPVIEAFLIGITGIAEGSSRVYYRMSNDADYSVGNLVLSYSLDGTSSGLYEFHFSADMLQQGGISFIVTTEDLDGSMLRYPTGISEEYYLSPVHDLIAVRDRTVPDRFVLYQNYPNPFNDQTVIRFDIPDDNHVTLVIYDILGRRVTTLTDEFYLAGEHEAVWRPAGRASGIYFYRLRYGADADVGRMLYVR